MVQNAAMVRVWGRRVAKPSVYLAAAIMLADSAAEILVDAASELKDAGEEDGHQELTALAQGVSQATQRLRKRKDAIRASDMAAKRDRTTEARGK